MNLKYSQVKEIYKRANFLFYEGLYDERNLAHDMIDAAKQSMRLNTLRRLSGASFLLNIILLVVLAYVVGNL